MDPLDSTTTVFGLTTPIATMSPINDSTLINVVHNSTTFPTHFQPPAPVLSTTAETTLDYLSTTTSTTTTTSAMTISSATTNDSNSTSSLWSSLFFNYTSWLPSSYNGSSFSTNLNLSPLAKKLLKHPGADTLFETLVNGHNETSIFSPAFFETADFSEDELLLRLIWSNSSNISDWATLLQSNDTNSTDNGGGMGNDADLIPWSLVASISTAIVLACIIMATVIGKLIVYSH